MMPTTWIEKRSPELRVGDVVIGEGLVLAKETMPDELVVIYYANGSQVGYDADALLLLETEGS